jgi:peptidoglycan/LPS O-acetylase OafA/YrhL
LYRKKIYIFVISGYVMATLQLDRGYNAKIKTLQKEKSDPLRFI